MHGAGAPCQWLQPLRDSGRPAELRTRPSDAGESRGYPQNSASITAPLSPAQSPLKFNASE